MVEKEITNPSDVNQKIDRLKSIESGGKSNPKTQYPSATAGGKSKNTSDLVIDSTDLKTTHRENIRSQDSTFFCNGGDLKIKLIQTKGGS